MPAMGGVEATRHIAEVAPLTRVVMLTISDEDSDVTDAILAGACGYLLKDASIQELVSGIRAAARGEALISPHIAAKVLQRIRATSAQPEIEEMIRAELSEREIEVLKLIANGKDNAVIAAELHISPKTVKNHISNILMKLQIDNRIEAAVYAVRSGIRLGGSSAAPDDLEVVEERAQLREALRRPCRGVWTTRRARRRHSAPTPRPRRARPRRDAARSASARRRARAPLRSRA